MWNVGYTNYENSSDAQKHMLFCQDFSLITVSSHFVRMTLKKSKLDARTKRNFPASVIWNDVGYLVLLDICKYKLFGLLSKLFASLTRNYFPKRPSGAPLHTLSKLYYVPVGFVLPPPPYIEDMYCFICGRRRVAVARYRMIYLVLLYFRLDGPQKGRNLIFPV